MRRFLVAFFTVLSFVCSQNGLAQDPRLYRWSTMPGENAIGYNEVRVQVGAFTLYRRISFSDKTVIVTAQYERDIAIDTWRFEAPAETRIMHAGFKTDNGSIALVLLSNGNNVVLTNSAKNVWQAALHVPSPNTLANSQKIVGDAVYILKQGKVYASRDTAKTWAIDSTNIGTEYVQDITVDTSYYGWVITQNRNLYYQHPDSNIWRKNTSFSTTGFPQAIFVDRKGRMFVSTNTSTNRVWMSTNGGSSWANTSTGINQTITSFGDDAFGNIYAVGIGSGAFRLSNLTPPWVSIADSLNAQAYLPSTAKIVNAISGDTILTAATRYGMFHSTDFGANWVHSPDVLQLPAYNFYTGVVKAGNYYFVSTNLGIYRGVAIGDTTWQKVFPKQGFIWGVNVLSSDSAGNVYANIPFKTGPSTSLFYTVKSTDYGNTWVPDTAGHGALGINAGTQTFDFWVDRQGTQYLGGNGKFYSKKPAQSWKIDTSGLGMKAGEYVKAVTLNNKKGIIYLSRIVPKVPSGISLIIYSRAAEASAWQVVNTSTIGDGDAILSSDHDGNIIVKTFSTPSKIWRYDASTWTQTPLPTTIGSSPFPQILTIDRSGVLWASFFAGTSNKGVYFSTNNGTTWNYVGLNGVGINFLSAVGDTVYAVTFIDGIYGFTTSSTPTSVRENPQYIPAAFELLQNYPNPFNPSTTIGFDVPQISHVELTIYDVLGRMITKLVDEEKTPGRYRVDWKPNCLSSGIYFYRLRAGEFSLVKKLLLLR